MSNLIPNVISTYSYFSWPKIVHLSHFVHFCNLVPKFSEICNSLLKLFSKLFIPDINLLSQKTLYLTHFLSFLENPRVQYQKNAKFWGVTPTFKKTVKEWRNGRVRVEEQVSSMWETEVLVILVPKQLRFSRKQDCRLLRRNEGALIILFKVGNAA